jgi:protein-S-isoprenylcysteine O-methyltransferase Ste14
MQAYSLALHIISGCWLVFVAIWVLAALSTKRTAYRETQAQRLRYWVLLVIACFLQLYGRRLPYPLNLDIVPHVALNAWAAAVLCVIGLAFAVWARVTLGRNWSGAVTLKEEHELVASFWIKLRDEEKLMLQQFPKRYADYRRRAKCIIPFVL